MTLNQYSDGSAPSTDIPWANGSPYPARLWDDGYLWKWYRPDHLKNRWEAEFIANILVATGYTMPDSSRQITTPVTWTSSDLVTLPGDLEITTGGSLTINPGTTIIVRQTDLFRSGTDTTVCEIIVQSSRTLSADASSGNAITFKKTVTDTPGVWYGIRNLGGTITLKNCVIQDADIGVVASSGTTIIEDCDITDCNQGIMALTPATIARNRIWNTATAVDLNFSGSQTLQNNLIHSNSSTGIYAESEPVLAINSQTIANTPTGIYLDNGGEMEVDILNSILSKNWSFGIIESGGPAVTLNYSDVWGSSTAFSGDSLGTWSNPPNAIEGNEGNISSNPTFVDTTNADFHLDTGSPCINTGDPTMMDVDASRIDMGCYGGTAPRVNKPVLLSITDSDPTLPDKVAIDQNAPNPFNPETVITYALPTETETTLRVYNILGQEVRTLINGIVPAGYHRVVWDGRDAYGRPLSSGVYIYRFSAGNFVQMRKMLILK